MKNSIITKYTAKDNIPVYFSREQYFQCEVGYPTAVQYVKQNNKTIQKDIKQVKIDDSSRLLEIQYGDADLMEKISSVKKERGETLGKYVTQYNASIDLESQDKQMSCQLKGREKCKMRYCAIKVEYQPGSDQPIISIVPVHQMMVNKASDGASSLNIGNQLERANGTSKKQKSDDFGLVNESSSSSNDRSGSASSAKTDKEEGQDDIDCNEQHELQKRDNEKIKQQELQLKRRKQQNGEEDD